MRNAMIKTAILGFLLGAFLCATASAFAGEIATKQAESGGGLASAAHLGFAMIDHSSTGFDKVQGSMMFLDVTKRIMANLDLGMRTVAQGGQRDGEFYRMGAGPLLNYVITENWSVQLALGFFKETALDADGEKAYSSRGQNLMVGWERRLALSKRLDLLWGGFFSHHQGNIEPTAQVSTAGKSRFAKAETNRGQTHGLEVAVRMSL